MMETIKNYLLLCGLVVGIAGCGNSSYVKYGPNGELVVTQRSVTPLSPNDLAFLFPIDDQGEPFPRITLDSEPNIPGSGNFTQIGTASRAQGIFFDNLIADPDNWAMVGFRYSPCILFVGTENPCKEQMRFIYQPFDPGDAAFADFSMHVVYEFAAGDNPLSEEVLQAMVALRDTTDGETSNLPLGVHPILQDEATRREYFNNIRNLLWRPFIFDQSPKAITFMGLADDGNGGANPGEWRFIMGETNNSGVWELKDLPDGSGEQVEILGIGQDPSNAGNLISNINQNDDFNILTGNVVSERRAAAALLPQVTNEHNLNCASCHVVGSQIIRDTRSRLDITGFNFDQFAESIVNFLDEDTQSFGTNLFSNQLKSGFFTTAAGIPTEGPVAPEEEIVTRMFGYMHSQPVVSQRMAFDNALAVRDANRLLGGDASSTLNSGSLGSCDTFTKQVEALTCLFTGDFNTDLNQCIQQACE